MSRWRTYRSMPQEKLGSAQSRSSPADNLYSALLSTIGVSANSHRSGKTWMARNSTARQSSHHWSSDKSGASSLDAVSNFCSPYLALRPHSTSTKLVEGTLFHCCIFLVCNILWLVLWVSCWYQMGQVTPNIQPAQRWHCSGTKSEQ